MTVLCGRHRVVAWRQGKRSGKLSPLRWSNPSWWLVATNLGSIPWWRRGLQLSLLLFLAAAQTPQREHSSRWCVQQAGKVAGHTCTCGKCRRWTPCHHSAWEASAGPVFGDKTRNALLLEAPGEQAGSRSAAWCHQRGPWETRLKRFSPEINYGNKAIIRYAVIIKFPSTALSVQDPKSITKLKIHFKSKSMCL